MTKNELAMFILGNLSGGGLVHFLWKNFFQGYRNQIRKGLDEIDQMFKQKQKQN